MTAPHHRLVPPRPITRLLVANRGEIASRVFRTARDLGMGTVAVYSEPDALLPYVTDADMAVPLRGATPAQTYLDIDQLLAAARRTGADAVHPGYGFLAESATFARAVQGAGLVWVGPAAETIDRLGSKLQAKRAAAAAGVPLVASAELLGDDPGAWLGAAEGVELPVLVKASAGGGGRGMRLVEDAGELVEAVRSARREAAAAFGDGTVFLEHYLAGARHVEIQILGDELGSVVHLFERECSIQRRHQKIIEESPSPGTAVTTLRAMCAAATTLGRAVRYVGVGTVEFLVVGDDERQQFFFLEMNTRLQVEHAVTEMVTYKDLVKAQLMVAQGLPHGLSDGGFDRWEDDLDVLELPHDARDARDGRDGQDDPDDDGDELDDTDIAEHQDRTHAVEARLYAEDPAAGYLPSTGPVLLFDYSDEDSRVRWECTVGTGSVVSPYYDPLLAKVIAAGGTRQEAVAALTQALRGIRLHGLRTNRDQLVAVLESPPFQAGGTPTDFLDLFPELVAPGVPGEVQIAHLVAAVLSGVRQRRASAPLPFAPAGWRNVPSGPDGIAYRRSDGTTAAVSYRVGAVASSIRGTVDIDGVEHTVTVHGSDEDGVDAVVDGVRRRCLVAVYGSDDDGGDLVCVDGGGWSTQWVELPRFAAAADGGPSTSPTAPVPGTVTAILVRPGELVVAGQGLVVLEAMKMEHRVSAAMAGSVEEVLVEVGQAVDAHDILVTLSATEAGAGAPDREPTDG
jgi:acetyl/propionyl-CoA carboxylase alpha subunit